MPLMCDRLATQSLHQEELARQKHGFGETFQVFFYENVTQWCILHRDHQCFIRAALLNQHWEQSSLDNVLLQWVSGLKKFAKFPFVKINK